MEKEPPIVVQVKNCEECNKKLSGNFFVMFYPTAGVAMIYCDECAKELGYIDDSKCTEYLSSEAK